MSPAHGKPRGGERTGRSRGPEDAGRVPSPARRQKPTVARLPFEEIRLDGVASENASACVASDAPARLVLLGIASGSEATPAGSVTGTLSVSRFAFVYAKQPGIPMKVRSTPGLICVSPNARKASGTRFGTCEMP